MDLDHSLGACQTLPDTPALTLSREFKLAARPYSDAIRLINGTISRERRSTNLPCIRRRDTKPEITIRQALHKLGFRFRFYCGRGISESRPVPASVDEPSELVMLKLEVKRRLLTPSGNSPCIAGTARRSNHCKLARHTASSNLTSRQERRAAPIVAATVSLRRVAASGFPTRRSSIHAISSRTLVPPPALSTNRDATSAGPGGGLHCSHDNECSRIPDDEALHSTLASGATKSK